jgi:hypothetical protein
MYSRMAAEGHEISQLGGRRDLKLALAFLIFETIMSMKARK